MKRSVDMNLKSSFLPARITALHGMLYLLQSAVIANCEETMNVVHPLAIKYIQKHIEVNEANGQVKFQKILFMTIVISVGTYATCKQWHRF